MIHTVILSLSFVWLVVFYGIIFVYLWGHGKMDGTVREEVMAIVDVRVPKSLVGQLSLIGPDWTCCGTFVPLEQVFLFPCGLRVSEETGIMVGNYDYLFYAHERHHFYKHSKRDWLMIETIAYDAKGCWRKVTASCDCEATPSAASP